MKNLVAVIRRRTEAKPETPTKLDRLVNLFRAAMVEGFTGRIAIDIKDGVPVSVEVFRRIKL